MIKLEKIVIVSIYNGVNNITQTELDILKTWLVNNIEISEIDRDNASNDEKYNFYETRSCTLNDVLVMIEMMETIKQGMNK